MWYEQNIIKLFKRILLGACSLQMLISGNWNYVNCLAGVAIRYIYEYKLEVIIVMLVSPLRKKAEYKKSLAMKYRYYWKVLYMQKWEIFEVWKLLLN